MSDDSDCDPDDPAIHPAADERCNGLDDDCDGDTDGPTAIDATTWYTDADSDSYGDSADPEQACAQPAGTAPAAGDCDDSDVAVNPAALETCSEGDDDCDGLIDEADASDAGIWYSDQDGDGFGDAGVSACEARHRRSRSPPVVR